MLKKIIVSILVSIMIVMTISCKNESNQMDGENEIYKEFNRIRSFTSKIPEDYKYTNYSVLANLYNDIVFDFDAKGKYFPLIWKDETYQSFGIPAFVGDHRMNIDGAQEAVTTVAAVLSATLLGIDKSNQDGIDYVNMLNAYFSETEGIILNNPAGNSATTSMWYLLYPAILYTQVSNLYENQTRMRDNTLKNIESWYRAYEVMYNNGQPDFNYTGFNFITNTPYRNEIWTEPDSAVGIAVLMYTGYELTGDEKYLIATINLMDYIEDFFGSPLYEILMYFAPKLTARLNVHHGTNYDITRSLNRIFDGSSIPRGGWGAIVGKWGDYEMNGLFGSTKDGGGYAFAMNTFAAAGVIAPVVYYDSRYARSIGKWLLHLSNNSRYFFAGETNKANQSITYIDGGDEFSEDILRAIPYEGIRKQSNGRIPWFGGDPTVYGWGTTDFSLYSGSHLGILGALIEETNQKGILKIDLVVTQTPEVKAYPTYLIYNPHSESKEVNYYVQGDTTVDLYDAVTNTVIARGVSEETVISISPDATVVIVEIPANADIIQQGLNNYVDGIYISTNRSTVSFLGLRNHTTVTGKFTIEIALASNFKDSIKEATLFIDNQVFSFKDNKVQINANEIGKGSKRVIVQVITENGIYDETVVRLNFE